MSLPLLAGLLLAGLALTGAWLDLTTRRLPNWLCLITATAGLGVALGIHGVEAAGSALLHGVIALVIGMVLFRFGAIGGGDAKFYAGLAMWFRLGLGTSLLLGVSLAGLGLFLVWFGARRMMDRKVQRRSALDSEKFPYGIAIAAGALATWFAPYVAL